MKHYIRIGVLLLLCVFSTALSSNAQSPYTKAQVEALKAAIPYPQYNVGDIMYIAFIKGPEIGTNIATEKDLVVSKVKIVEMMLCNDIGGKDWKDGVFLTSSPLEHPMKWKYQFLDAAIKNPKVRDRSDFHDESLFAKTPYEAKKKLLDFIKGSKL